MLIKRWLHCADFNKTLIHKYVKKSVTCALFELYLYAINILLNQRLRTVHINYKNFIIQKSGNMNRLSL